MKKDDYLTTTMLVPPKQHVQITPFDARTQRESFTVSPDGLKGVRVVSSPPFLRSTDSYLVEYQRSRSGIRTSSRGQEKTGSYACVFSQGFRPVVNGYLSFSVSLISHYRKSSNALQKPNKLVLSDCRLLPNPCPFKSRYLHLRPAPHSDRQTHQHHARGVQPPHVRHSRAVLHAQARMSLNQVLRIRSLDQLLIPGPFPDRDQRRLSRRPLPLQLDLLCPPSKYLPHELERH